jgi:adenine-specific DNA-methyltransferase
MQIIKEETEDVHIFCDIFAGTAAVSHQAIKHYDKVIINDFLFSNNVIYNGFFAAGDWDREKLCDIITAYNALVPEELPENYFSENFGGKFYEKNVAKQIGYIRQDIENLRPELTAKEYNVLLTTLIYNIDRLANTVGHFDAYIKKPIKPQPLRLRLIDAQTFDNVEIHREDSNLLARKTSTDVVYIDPPYNSRQYCRFYHLYETLVKWDKPKLYGVALKPTPENMSSYCTCRAVTAFEDLVSNIKAKYIVVSYNNTYNSKSNSSENKIRLEDIEQILNKCGETNVFEHAHQFFNTGKTEFDNHKEFLFVTKVNEKKRSKSFASLLRR